MTRRHFLSGVAAAAAPAEPLIIPVQHLIDTRARWSPVQIGRFWPDIWSEAIRDLSRAGIRLEATRKEFEIRRSPSGRPMFNGLQTGAINFIVTDWIPRDWDGGRSLAGVTTRLGGYHLCMVALHRAHGHRIPFVSVNSCLHELLHALLLDIFEHRPKGPSGAARELRIDWYATRLWLFHDSAAIRKSAETYVRRLRAELS